MKLDLKDIQKQIKKNFKQIKLFREFRTDINTPLNIDSYFTSGFYKGAIVPCDDNDFVIKFPLTSDRDDEDNCKEELRRSKLIEAAGFGDLIAKTKSIGKIKGVNFYMQEKAVTIYDNGSFYNKEEPRPDVSRLYDFLDFYPNFYWLIDLVDYCGYDRAKSFLLFLQENKIMEDLHDGNIGYIDNRPVLIDYAGCSLLASSSGTDASSGCNYRYIKMGAL